METIKSILLLHLRAERVQAGSLAAFHVQQLLAGRLQADPGRSRVAYRPVSLRDMEP